MTAPALLAAWLASAPAVAKTSVHPGSVPLAGGPVVLGVALPTRSLDKKRAVELVRQTFTSATPEVALKWSEVQPRPYLHQLDRADAWVDTARDQALRVRGHTLVWHGALPRWLPDDPDLLRAAMIQHVSTMVGRYAGRVAEWDVVNEPLAEDGGLHDDLLNDRLGVQWMADAFYTARQADPDALLFLNETDITRGGPKQDGAVDLVTRLLHEGVPIDGVGLQLHVDADHPVSRTEMEVALQRFADLGLKVAFTELDVRTEAGFADTDTLDALHRVVVQDATAACARQPACTGATVWGLTDADSWLRLRMSGEQRPTLFDSRGAPKPALYGARAGTAGQPVAMQSTELAASGARVATGGSAAQVGRGGQSWMVVRHRDETWAGPGLRVTEGWADGTAYRVALAAGAWQASEAAAAHVQLTARVEPRRGPVTWHTLAVVTPGAEGAVDVAASFALPVHARDVEAVTFYLEGPGSDVVLAAADWSVRPVVPVDGP